MISLDTETTGLDVYHGARPFFVTICDEEGEQRFWEWEVDPHTREVVAPLDDVAEIRMAVSAAKRIVLQNAKFDVAILREAGIIEDWPWEKTEDTLIAGHLLRSNQAHDLTTMALVYLGVNIEPFETEMKKMVMKARNWARRHKPEWRIAKEGLPDMPSAKEKTWGYDMWLLQHYEKGKYADLLRDYSNTDSAVTIKLWEVFEERIKEEGLWEIYRKRMKLLPVASDMERRGITVSRKRLEEQTDKYELESAKSARMCVSIARTCDYDLTLPKSGNNKSLVEFCFGEDGIKLPVIARSEKTGAPSFDKTVVDYYLSTMDEDSKQWRFVKNLSDKRKRDTAISYMDGYRRFWLPHSDGRLHEWFVLHPSLNPTGTDTLRWSSSNPNEQNISSKEDFNLRYSFGPAPGREWWSLDYENIELRIPAYESGETAMIELFEKPDDPPFFGSYHLLNASIVFPKLFWPIAKIKGAFKERYEPIYKRTKNGGFSIQYGAQRAKADATFGVRGAYDLIQARTPKLTKYKQEVIAFANKHGYVETLIDRSIGAERGYPIYCRRSAGRGGISPTIPFSYKIQSTAMWCTAKAMPRCKTYLDRISQGEGQDYFIALQVHDEIVFDFPAGGAKNLPKIKELQRLMEMSGKDIGVPLRVAASYHPNNWSKKEKIESRPERSALSRKCHI